MLGHSQILIHINWLIIFVRLITYRLTVCICERTSKLFKSVWIIRLNANATLENWRIKRQQNCVYSWRICCTAQYYNKIIFSSGKTDMRNLIIDLNAHFVWPFARLIRTTSFSLAFYFESCGKVIIIFFFSYKCIRNLRKSSDYLLSIVTNSTDMSVNL